MHDGACHSPRFASSFTASKQKNPNENLTICSKDNSHFVFNVFEHDGRPVLISFSGVKWAEP